MLKKLPFFLLCICTLGLADNPPVTEYAERPKVPAPGVDADLVGANGPRAFFEKQASDAACVSDLGKVRSEYRTILTEIESLKKARPKSTKADGTEDAALKTANDAIDAKGVSLKEKRKELLALMQKCGECSAQDVKPWKVKPTPKRPQAEMWYVTDGSCQIPSKDTKVLESAFQEVSNSLVHAKSYPAYSPGGFGNVLEFQLAKVTGAGPTVKVEFLPKEDKFPASPIHLGIWIRGFEAFNNLFAFRYFIKANYEFKDANGLKEFWLTFNTVDDDISTQKKVVFPDTVTDLTTSGRVKKVKPNNLKNVQGLWYLNSDGYIRYYTAAVFPFPNDNLAELGKNILLDTLTTLSERGKWEAP
jgi:hypothetical protein